MNGLKENGPPGWPESGRAAGRPACQAAVRPKLGHRKHEHIKETTGFISIYAYLVSHCGSRNVKISRKRQVL